MVNPPLAAATTSAYVVGAKIALKLPPFAMRAIERFRRNGLDVKRQRKADVYFLEHYWFFNALLLSQAQSRLFLRVRVHWNG